MVRAMHAKDRKKIHCCGDGHLHGSWLSFVVLAGASVCGLPFVFKVEGEHRLLLCVIMHFFALYFFPAPAMPLNRSFACMHVDLPVTGVV